MICAFCPETLQSVAELVVLPKGVVEPPQPARDRRRPNPNAVLLKVDTLERVPGLKQASKGVDGVLQVLDL